MEAPIVYTAHIAPTVRPIFVHISTVLARCPAAFEGGKLKLSDDVSRRSSRRRDCTIYRVTRCTRQKEKRKKKKTFLSFDSTIVGCFSTFHNKKCIFAYRFNSRIQLRSVQYANVASSTLIKLIKNNDL